MELPKIDFRYLKQAFKEPINFWGMAGFAITAAYVQDVTPLIAALAAGPSYRGSCNSILSPWSRRRDGAHKLRDAWHKP